MHKITKGLKKKKKGKKSKHKDEELFTQEELEAYRREHQHQEAEQTTESGETKAAAADNEEWKKFSALTAGVDNILKKTQGDLDRIKSTSFFQRIPPPSEVKRQEEEAEKQLEESKPEPTYEEKALAAAEAAIVPVSESESEEEDEDDIFDTAYIDAIAAGEVKLAYIPESPTDQQEGDDPFDTSYAERAILGPAVERKGKRLVPLGAAVEVLTGRVQAPTCVSTKRPSSRRQILREKDLLLGSFEEGAHPPTDKSKEPSPPKTSLLDEGEPPPITEPIDLSKSLYTPVTPVTPTVSKPFQARKDSGKDILEEFDVIAKDEPLEDDDEFALLAAESLSKTPAVSILPVVANTEPVASLDDWKPFGDEKSIAEPDSLEDFESDPFDTKFAENLLPGRAELKQIENEILNTEIDFDFDPRAEEKYSNIINTKVHISITDPTGQRESVSSLDRISEDELNLIKPSHRDLLGGSISDLSNLGDQPLKPSEKTENNYIEYSDPFDTSIVDTVSAPGQTELKFLERELLSDIKKENSLEDDDFDPRATEANKDSKPETNTISRKVSFDLPLGEVKPDLLSIGGEDSKVGKPLTPYYAKDLPIQEQGDSESDIDPFDTTFVIGIAPGKAELKLIESELCQTTFPHSILDNDFDPRDEKQVAVAKVVQTIKEISQPKVKEIRFEEPKQIDLLAAANDIAGKVLTPAAEISPKFGADDIESYIDPFDTSIANNILPGKTELKLLESELIKPNSGIDHLDDPNFDPRYEEKVAQLTGHIKNTQVIKQPLQDLLENPLETVQVKPLTPIGNSENLDFDISSEDIDPFDTSIANNIGPGRAELKLLESELI